MRLDWLEDILAVAETGSLQVAAEKRRLSQSAFSRRLRAIETGLDVTLFDRSARPTRLLPHVQEQTERMRDLAAGLRDLTVSLRDMERTRRRRLVLAAQHAITTATAPLLVERLASLDLEIRLRSANREECLALLMTREVDVALVYDVAGEAPLLGVEFMERVRIGDERLIPVCASGAMERLNAGFGRGELPVIAYPGEMFMGAVQRRLVFPALSRFIRPSICMETELTLAALQFARTGFGVAWIPRSLVTEDLARETMRELSNRLPAIDMELLATRLRGSSSRVSGAVWEEITRN